MEKRSCPECIEGVVWKSCADCEGSGDSRKQDGTGYDRLCDQCAGAGERPAGRCSLCEGSGEITYALMRLAEASKYAQRTSPDWSGDNADHEGVTVYSMAEWFRRRSMSISRAWGGLNNGEQIVWLIDAGGHESIRFTGLSWGYGGEGPHGLATILADVFEDFEGYDVAMAFVNRLPRAAAGPSSGETGHGPI